MEFLGVWSVDPLVCCAVNYINFGVLFIEFIIACEAFLIRLFDHECPDARGVKRNRFDLDAHKLSALRLRKYAIDKQLWFGCLFGSIPFVRYQRA